MKTLKITTLLFATLTLLFFACQKEEVVGGADFVKERFVQLKIIDDVFQLINSV